MANPLVEQPREGQPEAGPRKEPDPAPLTLPAPEKLPEPKQPEVPRDKEPTKQEPSGDTLQEAPPRSGEKNDKQGAILPERPSFSTTRAKGQWVARGAVTPKPTEADATPTVMPVSDLEMINSSAEEKRTGPAVGRPRPMPANVEASPLSSVRPVRDASVRGVSWTEPSSDGGGMLPNPLRRR